jgi:hypothetical protein
MNWNPFLILSGMNVIRRWLRVRRENRAYRRAEARVWIRDRLSKGQVGITRARLLAKQRKNPLSVPEDLVNADNHTIIACGAFYLDIDENPCESLEAMEGEK